MAAGKEPEVYLFTGPENGDKSEALETIRKNADKSFGPLDFYRYYASETRVADVVSQLQNASLFSGALFIVLKNAELIKGKADIDLLVSYIKGAAGSPNTLVLESDENGIEKRIEAAVPASRKKIFWEMFESQKPLWVRRYFQKNGFRIEDEAVDQILDMVENNTEVLKSECSRFFFCFEKGYCITVADVDNILSHNREENAFTLFDSMAEDSRSPKERLESSLAILQKIRLSRDSGGVMILSGLAYCFRQLRLYHSLCSGGKAPTEAQFRTAGFASKRNRARYAKAARIWGPGTVASILALLSATDMADRESGMSGEDTRLTLLVYSIVIKNGLFPAVYEAAP